MASGADGVTSEDAASGRSAWGALLSGRRDGLRVRPAVRRAVGSGVGRAVSAVAVGVGSCGAADFVVVLFVWCVGAGVDSVAAGCAAAFSGFSVVDLRAFAGVAFVVVGTAMFASTTAGAALGFVVARRVVVVVALGPVVPTTSTFVALVDVGSAVVTA